MVGLVVIADRWALFLLHKYWSYCYCRMVGLIVIADRLVLFFIAQVLVLLLLQNDWPCKLEKKDICMY
jgi:hypothetical protein